MDPSLLLSVLSVLDRPEEFCVSSHERACILLERLRDLYNEFQSKAEKPFGPLEELLVDGMDLESIWEELQTWNRPLIRSLKKRTTRLRKEVSHANATADTSSRRQKRRDADSDQENEDDADDGDEDEDEDEEEEAEDFAAGSEDDSAGTESENDGEEDEQRFSEDDSAAGSANEDEDEDGDEEGMDKTSRFDDDMSGEEVDGGILLHLVFISFIFIQDIIRIIPVYQRILITYQRPRSF